MDQDLKVKVQEQEEEWAAAERKAADRMLRSPVQVWAKAGKQELAAAAVRDRVIVQAGNSSN